MSADALVRTVSADGGVSVRALLGTGLVREAALRHGLGPTATSALGRTLMGALLLASGQAEDETVQVQLRGEGPLGTVMAISDGAGRVRGFVAHPGAEVPPRGGKLDVAAAVGPGVLAVVRFRPTWREPYSGLVPIQTGEIASDLAHYLSTSEQKPSAVALGVYLEAPGEVTAAGGFLVQALPDAADETVAAVETCVRALPPVSELLRGGTDADGLVDRLLATVGARERHRAAPRFHCGCSRERVLRTLVLLGREELRGLQERREPVETTCRFCAERYVVEPDELGTLVPDA